MTLKSPLEDLRENTLAAIPGCLAKLSYLGSLHQEGGYQHWGLSRLHGEEASDRALKKAHAEVLSAVLQTPISALEEDLRESSQASKETADAYLERMRGRFKQLLTSPQDTVAARHLNSVLVALSSLEANRRRATPSASSRSPRPGR
jgi:hypothetical protein